MRILAIESSGPVAGIAIADNGVVRAEFSLNDGRTHSEKLLPLIDAALNALSLEASDMDCFAVSVGPGSFTGLRIGVATANALAFAAGKPVVQVPTLSALMRCATAGRVLALLDAGNARAYSAYYEYSVEIWGPEALPLAEIPGRVPFDAVTVGDLGADAAKALGLSFSHALPRAALVAEAAAELAAQGCFVKEARPLYLLKPQAQRTLEGKP